MSGCAALVYQVTWQRILALQTGVGLESVTLIVAAFMLGLGAGNQIGGTLSRRLSPRQALLRFVLLELGIGAFGAMSPALYYDLLYQRGSWLYAQPLSAAAMHFLSLLPPTLLMGMSLPLLTRALVLESGQAARVIGCLYAANIFGASAGALLTPYWLIRSYGIRDTLLIAAAANVAAAVLAALGLRSEPERTAASEPAAEDIAPPSGVPYEAWLLLFGCSGFLALSLEILWFRVVEVAVRATAFTFGTVLSLYLLGLGAGSLVGAVAARRWRQPLRVFLLCQSAVALYAALSITGLTLAPEAWPGLGWYLELWRGERSFNLGGPLATGAVARLYLVLPLVLFGPATFLMGLSFPVLQRAVQSDGAAASYRVGRLMAANIIGCVAGSLFTGLVLLNRFGTIASLRLLLLLALCAFVLPGLRYGGRRGAFALSALALLAAMAALPPSEALWRRLHGFRDQRALLAEDATSVVMLEERPPRWLVWVDGKTNSSLPFGGTHTRVGALPALLHPEPERIAVVGLTSGDTAWAAGCRPTTRSLTVYELAAPQLKVLRRLAEEEEVAKLPRFLRDPRYRIVTADGRQALHRAETTFDIIAIDGPRPSTAYSGNLYAQEFFELCARRLSPGGVVSAWVPSGRIAGGFRRAFPHVLELPGDQIMLGRLEPFGNALAEALTRLDSPELISYLSPDRVVGLREALDKLRAPVGSIASEREVNHDLFPRDEFNSPEEARTR